MRTVNRRQFLQGGSVAALTALAGTRSVHGANDRIVVAAIGTSRNEIGGDGRGTHLARCFAGCPNTHIAYVCDVDKRNVEKGYRSVLLCHLGNISYRLGRSIRLDPATHQIADDKEASGLWGREYRPDWEPQV